MKGYKGFKKNDDGTLMCRGMVYEPGKKYTCEGEIVLCERGFHACHELHQVWPFCPNNGENVFYEVECGGEIIESEDGDGKFVCSEIELVKEVELSEDCARFKGCCLFSEGFGLVQREDEKMNYIKPDGTLLSDEWYKWCYDFNEGFGKVRIDDNESFYLDEEGNEYDCVDGEYAPRKTGLNFQSFFEPSHERVSILSEMFEDCDAYLTETLKKRSNGEENEGETIFKAETLICRLMQNIQVLIDSEKHCKVEKKI